MVLLALAVSWGNSFAAHQITAWPENKKGAVSLGFDDGCPSHLSLGIPALDARGFKGTFFLITGESGDWVASWDSWRNAASNGHEIGSHTMTHPWLTDLTPAQVQNELAGSQAIINFQIPSQKCLTLAYPFGNLNNSVASIAQNIYMASRGISCGLNSEPFDFSNVRACSPDDGDDIYAQADAAEQQGKWLFAFIHSLDGGSDCWGNWEIDMWTTYLDYLKKKNLWVGTFGATVKYIKERGAATLSVLSSSSDQIVLQLSDTLDDAIYDQPLTLRSEVPSSWATVEVKQGSSTINLTPMVEGTTRVIYYNAVPDRGSITLKNPQVSSPQISGLAPQFATVGSPAFTLSVSGSNFVSGAKVRWNGSDRTTAFVSATQLQANILAADLAAAGMIPVTVLNPNGAVSNAVNFEVRVLPPSVADLSPSVVTAGAPAFTLGVYGTNFLSGAKVRWNGADRVTTFVSATQLQASIPAADVATPGTRPVTVLNPDGGLSNAVNFAVWGPAPTVTSLSPSYATAGSPAFTLSVSGTNFVSGAKVRWNGSDRTTTFVSATQLRASVTAADIATVGTASVTVANPDGGVSNPMTFEVWAPPPFVTSLNPSYATAGASAFTLGISGTDFVSGAKVRWNGADRTTTFVSATQLQANILAADIATTGTASVTVVNPDGGVSNTMTFEVRAPAAAYTDDFNRSNQSPLGGNWASWDFGYGRLELYGNQVRSTDTNPYNVWSRRTSEPYGANHYSQMKLTSTPSREVGGPAVRVQLNGSEINGYIFTVLNSTTAAIWVRYGASGTWQQVGTNFTGTFASGDVYKLAISGNVLTAYRNGVSLGTRTDGNNRVPSGGSAGMSIVNPGTWDDWQGGA
jgi:peptidoglycan/xylan/chitin deacetylase (PgdA/CDA1 family)